MKFIESFEEFGETHFVEQVNNRQSTSPSNGLIQKGEAFFKVLIDFEVNYSQDVRTKS